MFFFGWCNELPEQGCILWKPNSSKCTTSLTLTCHCPYTSLSVHFSYYYLLFKGASTLHFYCALLTPQWSGGCRAVVVVVPLFLLLCSLNVLFALQVSILSIARTHREAQNSFCSWRLRDSSSFFIKSPKLYQLMWRLANSLVQRKRKETVQHLSHYIYEFACLVTSSGSTRKGQLPGTRCDLGHHFD